MSSTIHGSNQKIKVTSRGFPLCAGSWREAVVFFENFAEFVVRQGDDFVIFDAGHGFGGDHGVDHGLFGGLDGGGEDGLDLIVGKHFQIDDMVGSGPAGIGRGEGDENVAGAVAGNTAVAAEPQRNASSKALELVRDERRVRGNNDDDRAMVVIHKRSAGVRYISGNFSSHGNAGDAQIVFRAVVALHKNSNRVTAVFCVQLAGGCADSSFEAVADHSGATANVAFRNRAGRRGIDGVQSVLRLHVESVDVVEPAVPRF